MISDQGIDQRRTYNLGRSASCARCPTALQLHRALLAALPSRRTPTYRALARVSASVLAGPPILLTFRGHSVRTVRVDLGGSKRDYRRLQPRTSFRRSTSRGPQRLSIYGCPPAVTATRPSPGILGISVPIAPESTAKPPPPHGAHHAWHPGPVAHRRQRCNCLQEMTEKFPVNPRSSGTII